MNLTAYPDSQEADSAALSKLHSNLLPCKVAYDSRCEVTADIVSVCTGNMLWRCSCDKLSAAYPDRSQACLAGVHR